jgi:hypothetical protein
MDIAEGDEEVCMLKAGLRVEFCSNRTNHFQLLIQRGAGVDEDIGSRFQGAVVLGTGVEANPGAPNSRCWVGWVVAIAVWL